LNYLNIADSFLFYLIQSEPCFDVFFSNTPQKLLFKYHAILYSEKLLTDYFKFY